MRKLMIAALTAGVALSTAVATADPILDQHQDTIGNLSGSFGQTYLGQTFTVGISGMLTRVDIPAQASFQFNIETTQVIEIWNTENGFFPAAIVVPSSPLGSSSSTFTPNQTAQWFSFNFNPGVPVTAGQQLALVRIPSAPAGSFWAGDDDGTLYEPGHAFVSDANGAWVLLESREAGADFAFRTYVEPTGASMLADLLTSVTGKGSGKSLANKVKLAQTYYAANDIPATCAVLSDFIKQVKAQRTKKQLTAAQADDFTEQAMIIMTAIGCDD